MGSWLPICLTSLFPSNGKAPAAVATNLLVITIELVNEVYGCYLVTFLYRTLIVEWCLVRSVWNEEEQSPTKYIINQCLVIGCESELVGLALFKNALGAGWGLLPTLRWVDSWLLICLTSFFSQVERRFHGGNRTAIHFVWKWVPF